VSSPFCCCSPFLRHTRYTAFVSRWCTVTVSDPDGRRHSLDVLADSTYDVAHLFVVEAKKERAVGIPEPTLTTVFEVVANGKVYHVAGTALQRWIVERRQKWSGPKGYFFPAPKPRMIVTEEKRAGYRALLRGFFRALRAAGPSPRASDLRSPKELHGARKSGWLKSATRTPVAESGSIGWRQWATKP
jgi:hypothetical protein